MLRGLYFLENVKAEFELRCRAELRDVAAENQEVGGGIYRLDFGRSLQLSDETRIDGFLVEMRVRYPGELERLFGRIGDVHRVEQRPPSEGLRNRGRSEQTRFVDENSPRQP